MVPRIFFYLLVALNNAIVFSSSTLSHHQPTIAIIGTGYVGLVTGACLAESGYQVYCVDCEEKKIKSIIDGPFPLYEPGLEELVKSNYAAKKLIFTTDTKIAIEQSSIIIITVGTPLNNQGTIDLTAFESVARDLSTCINSYKILCIKSTVPLGTAQWLENFLTDQAIHKTNFDIISLPEFLREGNAINDFFNPDRLIIGGISHHALTAIKNLHSSFLSEKVPCIVTDNITAESIKYACNAFLALKISFINEFANLCEAAGASTKDVIHAMGLDKRISPLFLTPGPGFGGSCFPKDSQTLLKIGEHYHVPLRTVKASLTANEFQKQIPFKKIQHALGNNLEGKTVTILGLSFKANTDDIRGSASIDLISALLKAGASVKAYDPQAMPNMQHLFPEIEYSKTMQDALTETDAVVIMTEWKEFKILKTKKMVTTKNIIDMRNILKENEL